MPWIRLTRLDCGRSARRLLGRNLSIGEYFQSTIRSSKEELPRELDMNEKLVDSVFVQAIECQQMAKALWNPQFENRNHYIECETAFRLRCIF